MTYAVCHLPVRGQPFLVHSDSLDRSWTLRKESCWIGYESGLVFKLGSPQSVDSCDHTLVTYYTPDCGVFVLSPGLRERQRQIIVWKRFSRRWKHDHWIRSTKVVSVSQSVSQSLSLSLSLKKKKSWIPRLRLEYSVCQHYQLNLSRSWVNRHSEMNFILQHCNPRETRVLPRCRWYHHAILT